MPSTSRERYVLIGIAVLSVLLLLYGFLVAQGVFAAFGIALPLVALYLLWRFVRAHERIADALE